MRHPTHHSPAIEGKGGKNSQKVLLGNLAVEQVSF